MMNSTVIYNADANSDFQKPMAATYFDFEDRDEQPYSGG